MVERLAIVSTIIFLTPYKRAGMVLMDSFQAMLNATDSTADPMMMTCHNVERGRIFINNIYRSHYST
jgi:hypothetical protein